MSITIATLIITLDADNIIRNGAFLCGTLRDVDNLGTNPQPRFTFFCGIDDDPTTGCGLGLSEISYPTAREAMLAAALHTRSASHLGKEEDNE